MQQPSKYVRLWCADMEEGGSFANHAQSFMLVERLMESLNYVKPAESAAHLPSVFRYVSSCWCTMHRRA